MPGKRAPRTPDETLEHEASSEEEPGIFATVDGRQRELLSIARDIVGSGWRGFVGVVMLGGFPSLEFN